MNNNSVWFFGDFQCQADSEKRFRKCIICLTANGSVGVESKWIGRENTTSHTHDSLNIKSNTDRANNWCDSLQLLNKCFFFFCFCFLSFASAWIVRIHRYTRYHRQGQRRANSSQRQFLIDSGSASETIISSTHTHTDTHATHTTRYAHSSAFNHRVIFSIARIILDERCC